MATIDDDGDLDTSKNDRSTANESNSASGSFDNGRSNKGKTMQKSTSSGSILNNDSRSPPRLITSSNRTIYTAGRPPWYNAAGQFEQAFVIGLCGGSASGKTSLARKIIESLNVPWVTMLSMDAFYKVLSEEKHLLANQNEYNFDCPDAIDYDVAVSTLRKLKEGKQVEIPVYDFTTHTRLEETKTVYGANVIIFEGIVSFCNKELLELMDMKIFVDADSDIRLARRLRRDIYERGRDLEGILKQYHKSVKPSYEEYIAPSRKFADIVVPRGSENDVAIDLIVHHVNKQLAKRGYNFRAELKCAHRGQPLPSNLYIVEKSPQVTGIHTKIRSNETNRDDFIFYSKRLMRLLFEYTLSLLPFDNITVQTPYGTPYVGKRFNGSICGVSILRAGETMEAALCSICKDVRVGKILIQTNEETDEPELHYLQLPKNIDRDYVILMDATLATGAAALMAIRVLLDHEVQEEKIFFVSMIAAESGTHTIAYAFPKVKIVTTAVDPELNDYFHILPGIGNFGDRFFGT